MSIVYRADLMETCHNIVVTCKNIGIPEWEDRNEEDITWNILSEPEVQLWKFHITVN